MLQRRSCARTTKQRSLACSKLHFADRPKQLLAVRIPYPNFAADNLAHVRRARFQLGALLKRNLQFQPGKLLGVADAFHAGELQHHAALMKPVLFQLQFAAAAVGRQARQLPAFLEALGKIRVQLRHNFAAPPLRTQHASDGDELAGYSTISN